MFGICYIPRHATQTEMFVFKSFDSFKKKVIELLEDELNEHEEKSKCNKALNRAKSIDDLHEVFEEYELGCYDQQILMTELEIID